MSYAKLIGLKKEIPDCEIMRLLSQNKELKIEDIVIIKREIKEGSGDFGGLK